MSHEQQTKEHDGPHHRRRTLTAATPPRVLLAYADTSVPIAFLSSRARGLSVITLTVVTSIYGACNSIVTVAVHQAYDTLIAIVAQHLPGAIRVRQTVLAHPIDAELVVVALRLTRPTLALLAGATLVVRGAPAIGGTSVCVLRTVATSVAAGGPAIRRTGARVLVASRFAGSVAACVVTRGRAVGIAIVARTLRDVALIRNRILVAVLTRPVIQVTYVTNTVRLAIKLLRIE